MSAQPNVVLAGYKAREALMALARRRARIDPKVFAQYVCRDNQGKRIELAPMHVAWHDLMTQHDRFVFWSHVEAGKTTQVGVLRTLFEIGRNPDLRVLVLSATHDMALKVVGEIAGYITSSDPLHEVFPDLVRTKKAEKWSPLDGKITVKRRHISKDPTVTAAGLGTNILGSRFDLVIIDDILSFDNVNTPAERKWVIDWVQANVMGRLTAQARLYIVGTAFHPDDAMHFFGKLFTQAVGQTRAWIYPALDPATQEARWPKQWPKERVEQRRKEWIPIEFHRQMLCEARADGVAIFQQAWIDAAIKNGENIPDRAYLERMPPGCFTVTGVDLAVARHEAADLTAFATILVNGDKFELLEVESGRYEAQPLLDKIAEVSRRWGSMVFVENNAAQDYIVQLSQGSDAIVRGITTGRNKIHPEYGVQRIATELFRNKWTFPSKNGLSREVRELIGELLKYDPREHTGDRMMALYMARQGVDIGMPPVAEVGYLNLQRR